MKSELVEYAIDGQSLIKNSIGKPATVVFFQRKPRSHGNFSIEILFDGIRNNLCSKIQCITAISKYESNGLWKRVYNIFEAYSRQGNVNHVTGDVHFLTYLLQKKKTVLTIHDCGFMNHSSAITRYILKFFWLTIPVKRSALVTVVSQATKNEVLKYVDCNPDKIRIIPNFVSPHVTLSPKNFNYKKPIILQIGTAPNKNLERLIESVRGVSCRLDIIGKLADTVIHKLNQYNIDYSNSYNLSEKEIIEKYQQCDMLAFVSTYEGFGMPILEAQATGRAVITSNVSSMPEVAGDGAYLVDPYDVDAIRQGILKIIEDKKYREQLIELGKENIKRYHIHAVAKQYLDIYTYLNLNS